MSALNQLAPAASCSPYTPVDRLLSRLEGVKQTSSNQYMARCPAHEDHNPSLSVAVKDGRILLHCFAGCCAHEILANVDLSLSDLFDKPLERGPIRKRDRWNERGLVKQLMPEIDAVLIAANQVAEGKPLSAVDQRRLCDAHKRILSVVELVA